jgi:transcriptional regulator with XRE-family HTH domain
VALKGKKPKCPAYPKQIITIGDALRTKRLEIRLRQIDVARIIGCDPLTIVNWETNRCQPRKSWIANVVHFLGSSMIRKGDSLALELVGTQVAATGAKSPRH